MTLSHSSDYNAPKALRLVVAPLDVFRLMSLPYYIRTTSKLAAARTAEKDNRGSETANFPPCNISSSLCPSVGQL